MKFYTVIYISLMAVILISAGNCQNKNLEKKQSSKDAKADQKMNNSFKIVLSSGGGFTGIYTGYTLYEDGKVEYWQKKGLKDSVLWMEKTDPEKILKYKTSIEGYVGKQRINSTGNMTTHLTLETGDITNTWFWNRGTKSGIAIIARDIEKFCRDLKDR